jgi:hypothetical protein
LYFLLFGVNMLFYISLLSWSSIKLCTVVDRERFSVFRVDHWVQKSGHPWCRLYCYGISGIVDVFFFQEIEGNSYITYSIKFTLSRLYKMKVLIECPFVCDQNYLSYITLSGTFALEVIRHIVCKYLMRFQVLTEASMKFRDFWDVAPWSHIGVDRRFGGGYCLRR